MNRPTADQVELLFDADRHQDRGWWVLLWVEPYRAWVLVFDPPSA